MPTHTTMPQSEEEGAGLAEAIEGKAEEHVPNHRDGEVTEDSEQHDAETEARLQQFVT